MDAGTWRGIFAVVMLVLFLGICAWAWSARRRSVFDAAARLPLEDDGPAREAAPPGGNGTDVGGKKGKS